ncbi:tripartite tricarboxylate transporter TctB family protein [Marininema mesophilum]|uniref:tripartite tricarboxylate transporter TctB family protein n=1 Tax=Marininema mesophilum TaxID=1048340 RepID=UPI000B85031C|nr:tripartite tricarboxylate transporter TctB family protein [Marininema mesophilum]
MNRTFDRWASIVFVLVGIFFIVASKSLSTTAYGSGVGPDVFPFGLGILLVLLSIRLFYETFRYQANEQEKVTLDWKRFLIVIVAVLFYASSLEWLGYILSTFIFLVITFQTMERGKWISTILVSGFFSGGVYYLYVNVLKGVLPSFPLF